MEIRTVAVTCLVPSALRKDDIAPYVARKLAGVGGFMGHVDLLDWFVFIEREKTWIVRVKMQLHKDGIPILSQRPIVRQVEEYRPRPPAPPASPRPPKALDDEDWEPSGMAASPGPLSEPYATLAKVAGVVILDPLFAALDVYYRLRSRYYRDWK